MITDEVYKRQLARIQGWGGYEIYPGSVKVWREELDKERITDEDLIAGVNSGLQEPDYGGWNRRPDLGMLKSKCHLAKNERRKREERRVREEEEKARGLGVGDMLERGEKHGSKKVVNWCKLTTERVEGNMDVDTFNQKHKQIGRGNYGD